MSIAVKAWNATRDQLLNLCGNRQLSPLARAAAGRALSELGDPRDLTELVTVPAGKFWMGSEQPGPVMDESPQLEMELPEFKLGKYPVTIGWWKQFIGATNYECHPESLKGFDNHPAYFVSQLEARAFCEWLTTEWRKSGRIAADEIVRLPRETEWEKAARGNDKRTWTWGNQFAETSSKGNTAESNINRTCAVGLFPDGTSPFGCLDMIGNVWEWTMSLGGKNIKKTVTPDEKIILQADQFFKHPYNAQDGRERITTSDAFTWILRGGSFNNDRHIARCAARGGNMTNSHYDNIGFRVVVARDGANTDGK
jgi:iron(II)-dependent oxidoreductase